MTTEGRSVFRRCPMSVSSDVGVYSLQWGVRPDHLWLGATGVRATLCFQSLREEARKGKQLTLAASNFRWVRRERPKAEQGWSKPHFLKQRALTLLCLYISEICLYSQSLYMLSTEICPFGVLANFRAIPTPEGYPHLLCLLN